MHFLSVLIEYNVTPTPESVSVSFPVLLPIYNDCCISSTFIHIFFHFRHFSTNLPWAICELFLRARAGCVACRVRHWDRYTDSRSTQKGTSTVRWMCLFIVHEIGIINAGFSDGKTPSFRRSGNRESGQWKP